jgi:penicillin-binding protein 1C
VEFCAVSELPTAACTHRVRLVIPGVSPISECEIHREGLIDDAQLFARETTTARENCTKFEFWPSDLSLFAQAGLPPHAAAVSAGALSTLARHGRAPRIVSPKSNVVNSLGDGDASRALSLQAETEPYVAKVYWFADRAFLGTSDHGTPLSWQPKPGNYRVIALDDHGRSDSCAVTFAPARCAPMFSLDSPPDI